MSARRASSWLAVEHHCANNLGADLAALLGNSDIDRPVVVGGLYNGQDAPPFAAGVDSGVNHSGVISGWHTHSLDQSDFNQWVMALPTAADSPAGLGAEMRVFKPRSK